MHTSARHERGSVRGGLGRWVPALLAALLVQGVGGVTAFGQTAKDPVADDFYVSFFRYGSPKTGELYGDAKTFAQARQWMADLLAWNNPSDGSPIVARVDIEWDEDGKGADGTPAVIHKTKTFTRKAPPRPSRPAPPEYVPDPAPRPGGPGPVTAPTETVHPTGPGSGAVGGNSGASDPGPSSGGDAGGGSGGYDPAVISLRRRAPSGRPVIGIPNAGNGGPRIRVFNGMTGELIRRYDYDANGNRDSGRPVAPDDNKGGSGDTKRLVMDDSVPKNQAGGDGKVTFSYDNSAKKSAASGTVDSRKQALQRAGEDLQSQRSTLDSQKQKLDAEKADLSRDQERLNDETNRLQQKRDEIVRQRDQLSNDKRELENDEAIVRRYRDGGWKNGYRCVEGNSYDNCSTHGSEKAAWFRRAEARLEDMNATLSREQQNVENEESRYNSANQGYEDAIRKNRESARQFDLDFRQHSTAVDRLNAQLADWQRKTQDHLQQVNALPQGQPSASGTGPN